MPKAFQCIGPWSRTCSSGPPESSISFVCFKEKHFLFWLVLASEEKKYFAQTVSSPPKCTHSHHRVCCQERETKEIQRMGRLRLHSPSYIIVVFILSVPHRNIYLSSGKFVPLSSNWKKNYFVLFRKFQSFVSKCFDIVAT